MHKKSSIFYHYFFIFALALWTWPVPVRALPAKNTLQQKNVTTQSISDSSQTIALYTPQSSLTGHYVKLLIITLILLILFWVSMKYIRKLQFGNDALKNTRITVLSRQYLTSKHSIWLVVIGGQKYLLGVTDHSVNLIDRLGAVSEQELAESKTMPLPSFGNLLEKLRKGKA